MKALRLLGLLIIAAHGLTAIWHLHLTTTVLPTMTQAQAWTAIGILTTAHLAVALVWWLLPTRAAGVLLLLLFAVALAFGTYEHFLSASPNNILHMSPGDNVTVFRLSSVLLFLLEIAGCWLGVRAARTPNSENHHINQEA